VEGCTVKDTATLCPKGPLADFLVAIEKKSYAPHQAKDDYICETADSSDLVAPVLNLSEYSRCPLNVELYTVLDDVEERVVVHHRLSDNKVILGYPQGDADGDGFEGHRPEDNYRVVMKQGHEGMVFDGTNAQHFLDTDGEEFRVFTKNFAGDALNTSTSNGDNQPVVNGGTENISSNEQSIESLSTQSSMELKRSHESESTAETGKASKEPRLGTEAAKDMAIVSK
jgi:hypothetical protein